MQKNNIIAVVLIVATIVLGAAYYLKINNTPYIRVSSPASGDVLSPGSVYQIKWNSHNIPVSNKISVTIRRIPPPPLQEEGQEFDPVIFTDIPNSGSHDWKVSDMYPTGNYVLGITSYTSLPITDAITAESAQFSILGKPTALECHDSAKYFAIEKSLSDTVGSDILIKYKSKSDQNIPCTYAVERTDFELKDLLAEYFLTFTDNFLILDRGTAPEPRGLIAYDLRTQEMVFTDSYAKPVTVKGDSIIYFSKTDRKPTVQNCPDLNDYVSNGLGAVIMSKVTVDLSSLAKKDSGLIKCLATQ